MKVKCSYADKYKAIIKPTCGCIVCEARWKAKELVEKFYNLMFIQANYDEFDEALWSMSKRQALIACDEQINSLDNIEVDFSTDISTKGYLSTRSNYLQEVKKEIEKL